MSIYYNEFNPESAAMIRQMMADGLIPHGDVDTRSILEVSTDDLKSYTQCHFFAGIAGWSFALQLANWPADRPVWTGSCPCQPFSAAGKQKGKHDERHLLPSWLDLISQCRPATIYGEQVASAIAHGWLDDVYSGLEAEGYAVGSAILPACSVGAPHKRDRLWFVAHATVSRLLSSSLAGVCGREEGSRAWNGQPQRCGEHGNVAVTQQHRPHRETGDATQPRSDRQDDRLLVGGGSELWTMADTLGQRGCSRNSERRHAADADPASQTGFWDNARYVACHDGKLRSIKPGIRLLAHGVQHRRPLLHALGNAIVPPLAAEFIKATM